MTILVELLISPSDGLCEPHSGTRTGDISFGGTSVGTKAMTDAIIANLG